MLSQFRLGQSIHGGVHNAVESRSAVMARIWFQQDVYELRDVTGYWAAYLDGQQYKGKKIASGSDSPDVGRRRAQRSVNDSFLLMQWLKPVACRINTVAVTPYGPALE